MFREGTTWMKCSGMELFTDEMFREELHEWNVQGWNYVHE